MATGINRVTLVGYLGQDPKIYHTTNETPVAKLSLATSVKWKDKQTGEHKDHTEWHRIIIFGKLAEVAEKYLHTGSLIYIEGQLQTRKWKDKDDIDRYTTEILVSNNGTLQMLWQRLSPGDNLPSDFPPSPIDFEDDIPL